MANIERQVKYKELNSIDNVIATLENIIVESESDNSPMGYFPVLYQKVTIKVKEGIENNFLMTPPGWNT